MKQTLAVRLGQQMAMTPQLQQSIKLMQLSTLELKQAVLEAVESNPLLELAEDDYDDDRADPEADSWAKAATEPEAAPADDADAPAGPNEPAEIPAELAVDVSWDEVYAANASPALGAPEESDSFLERTSGGASLRDDLLWQLNLAPLSERQRFAALVVIESVDEDGMLRAAAPDLLATLGRGYAAADVEAAVRAVQGFDPPGVGARDLRECLLLQLRRLPPETPWRTEAATVVDGYLALLGRGDAAALARRARIPEADLPAVLALIRSLKPRPGAAVGDAQVDYIEPDVVVRKRGGRWTVELNRALLPNVRVHQQYASYIKAGDNSRDNVFLRENLQEAKGFLSNLQYRNDTLLKVAANIVSRQRGFLERGDEGMRPLVCADVAAAVDRHESTISRVTNGKYMDTPRGVFELKHFFSSHVRTLTGGEVSSTAVRARVKRLTAEEDPRKPLSDARIAERLNELGIPVARRTVAKYREALAIPPASERKRLIG